MLTLCRQLARAALVGDIQGLALRTCEAGRVARSAVLSGAAPWQILSRVRASQRDDGGWVDNEDSVWCTALLVPERPGTPETAAALDWLGQRRVPGGGWGRNPRDQARIPLTAAALRFVGESIAEPQDWRCLDGLWTADLDMDVQLTYKGGFYLACQVANAAPTDLVRRTYEYMHSQPNEDGGFGPWKGHPIGSDPWSTGVCLAGLARFPELADLKVVRRAVEWLVETQLPSGYWPYHFIDEGTAYAYWGLSEAVRLLEGL